jgi:hypothetical protein
MILAQGSAIEYKEIINYSIEEYLMHLRWFFKQREDGS